MLACWFLKFISACIFTLNMQTCRPSRCLILKLPKPKKKDGHIRMEVINHGRTVTNVFIIMAFCLQYSAGKDVRKYFVYISFKLLKIIYFISTFVLLSSGNIHTFTQKKKRFTYLRRKTA